METVKKYKWALTGLIVMIILNALILGTIWLDHNDERGWHRHSDNDRARTSSQQFMKKELGLNAEQSEQIDALRREHYNEVRSIKKDLDETRRFYLNYILTNEDHDPEMKDSLVNALTQGYADIEESLYTHMQDIREILSDEQAERFKEFMQSHSRGNERMKRNNRN